MLKPQFLLILFCLLVGYSCKQVKNDKPIRQSINKILPLGASRVEGGSPKYESFRYPLWKKLTENGWEFDFIGTQSDRASYPSLENEKMDEDHEGRNGFTSGQLLDNLPDWLDKTGSPDIVLLSAPGGNDVLRLDTPVEVIVANYNSIIDVLQRNNPDVRIIIEKIAPAKGSFMNKRMKTAFQALHTGMDGIAKLQTSANALVIAVDMHTGFSDEMLADDVHYNKRGAAFIADRYYDVLTRILEK